jgi:hypothetical protein
MAAAEEFEGWRSRYDLWLEAFIVFNFLCLTGDIFLAHSANAFRNAAEYIPVYFSLSAALILAVGFGFRLKREQSSIWRYAGILIGWCAIMVGAAGVVYHLESRYFYERTLRGLTYAAPFAAPLSYIGLGFLLLMNRMVGQRTKEWAQWVIFLALGGFAGNFVLSLTDHAVNGFFHWTEWIPVVSSALAIGFLLVLLLSNTRRGYVWLCAAVVVLQAAVGVLGFLLHGWADLHGPSASLWANIVHGAPPFAPLLLPNLAILGILGLLAWARLPETERGT